MSVTAEPPELRQRLEALQRANEIRSFRAVVKREVVAGRRDVREVLDSSDERLESMALWELLIQLPKVGRVKLTKAFRMATLPPGMTVGRLRPEQRRRLSVYLPQLRP